MLAVGKVLKTISLVAAMGALIVATGGLALFGTTAAVTLFGVSAGTLTLVSLGAGIISTLLTPRPKQPPSQLSRLNVSLDPSTPRKVVFGTTAMPLDLRYHESSGTNQEYVDYIIALAAHKVTSISEIWFEEKQAWSLAGGVTGTYSGYLTVAVRTEGTAGNYISINGGGKWGASRRLTGCAYLHLRIKRTGNTKKAESPLASGLPSRVTVIGDGALLYDPRKDSTVPGGSGTHRATNQATWGAYTNADDTDNPALQLLWWMLGWEIDGKLSVGCGVPYTRIDMESFITAANICDENITLAIGGTQKRYRTSGTASDTDDRLEIINNFLASMNGTLRDNGGKLTVTVMKNDLADYVLSFNENDILGEFDWQQTGGLTENYNVARGRYVDPSANSLYQMVDYSEVGFASPDGVERVMSVDLPYIEDGRRAQRIAKQILQRNQYRGMLSTTFNAKALGCQVGDVVRISLEALGWSNKLFRVVTQEIRFDGQVPMRLVEENAAIYAWDADDVAPITPTAPTIYNPLNSPFILGIDDAGTTADWSAIVDDNGDKPEDNATRNVNRGAWSGSSVVYFVGDFVQRDGSSYSAIVAHTSTAGNGPPGANWALLAAGGGGTTGPAGTAAISGYLTKEAVQLFAYANGAVVSYTPASGSFKIFSGNTDVSSSFSLSTLSNPQALTVSYSSQTYSVTAGFDVNEDTASLTIRATGSGTYVGVTIDKVFSLSKAKGGYEIVATLPTTDLFEGRVVFLTTDDKLYRYTGSAWTAAVPAVDISGTLADAQIAALAASKVTGQLSDSQLAAIAAAKVTGQLTNTQIADLAATKISGQLTNAQIADLAATKISGQLTNAQIAAIAAAKVTGQIVDSQIAAVSVIKVNGGVGGGNLLSNSNFKSVTGTIDTNGSLPSNWFVYNNGTIPVTTRVVSEGLFGTNYYRITANAATTNRLGLYTEQGAAIWTPGIDYIISFWARAGQNAGAVGKTMQGLYSNMGFSPATAVENPALVQTTWQRYVWRVQAVQNASTALGELFISWETVGTLPSGSIIELCAVQVQQGSLVSAYAPRPDEILPSTITATEIATDAITTPKIVAGAIVTAKIAAGAVSANEIAANTITSGQIAANTITAGQIAANTITSGQIAANTITAGQIAASTITSSQIAADTITASNIAASAITATELAAGSVITGKIAADAVTANEIAANAITASEISAGAITTGKIAAGAVTANEIAANAITTAKIAAGSVTSNEIAANTIVADDIAANAITAVKIAAGSIETSKIAAGAIQTLQIDALAVNADKIQANAIVASKIASNAITADKIEAGSITAAKVGTNEIVALSANIKDGVISTAKIGDLQVSTLKIGNNAVTVPVYAYTSGSIVISSYQTIQSVSITTSGGIVKIDFSFLLAGNTSGCNFRLTRNGTDVLPVSSLGGGSGGLVAFTIGDAPAAGTYTYELLAQAAGFVPLALVRSLFVQEIKK